ncbi:MmgE/PrpD family protein [Rhodanobacter thiooxydans]|uniref:MmgE/PrpD family protein n=1 Tax=Rhodanobacter thiooxydans TaxID=416169 RepID=UPI000260DA01|nr:MmgE/PrpD family protein [Rhodanobacter thiooxydans]EIM00734.1 MmgE/PrpD family protein [Rhodanobacter thiooxydans LCS2]
MTEVQTLAAFVHGAHYSQLSAPAVEQLKIRILDTLGVAIGALDAPPMVAIRKLTTALGGNGTATLIGGGSSAPDRAAFYNIGLSRYLDFMDSYLAPGETCHPSDNIGAVMAAAESADASGKDFLTAVAVAYQVQTRMSDVAPVRANGFDHTVQGAYAAAAAVAKALGLDAAQTANAIAISGTANNALRVTRTGNLSNWKGLAYPQVGKEGVHAALLAQVGITGPEQVFEGNKGLKETITGPFTIDWSQENLESVLRTIIKKHNAEIHSQSSIDAAITITGQPGFHADAIKAVRITTFQVAYDIIGGGEEGDKRHIRSKEEADHSLPYMVAAALLDSEVQPQQYALPRILSADVQALLNKVAVAPDAEFSARFPHEMPSQVEVELTDGTTLSATAATYKGFTSQPLDWAAACEKFQRLVTPFADDTLSEQITRSVLELDTHSVRALTALLAKVPLQRRIRAAA